MKNMLHKQHTATEHFQNVNSEKADSQEELLNYRNRFFCNICNKPTVFNARENYDYNDDDDDNDDDDYYYFYASVLTS